VPTRLRGCVLAALLLAAPATATATVARHAPQTIAKAVDVAIFAALRDEHMQPRPVPLLSVLLVGAQGDTVRARTGVDGRAHVSVAPGRYAVSTPFGVEFEGRRVAWDLVADLPPSAGEDLLLGNDNARFSALAPAASPGASALDPSALYARLQGSVYRVQAGLARGSGFLADTLGGVILTNAHVVEPGLPDQISVFLDDSTRVPARLLAIDSEADVAALVVADTLLAGRARIALLARPPEDAIAVGDPLAALGYPLNQHLLVTTGIAASVRSGAVLSDVNINPGNSGGPLVNARGEAVAMNTFLDAGRVGAGVAGSISIPQLAHALHIATARDTLQRPPAMRLPTTPRQRIPLDSVKVTAARIDKGAVKKCSIPCGPFMVTLNTPYLVLAAARVNEEDVGKDRKKREEKAGVPEMERYSEVREFRDWADYVGEETAPVASVSVIPVAGETSGSVFTRMLVSPMIHAKIRFGGDVREVRVLRNGSEVGTIVCGHTPIRMHTEDAWLSFKDVADEGHCVFPVETLRPDSLGAPPSIVVAVRDLKHPKKYQCVELPADVVASAWNAFVPYFRERAPEMAVLADAKRAKHRKAASDSGVLRGESEWSNEPKGPR
jgi:S1-C subfamily serine protease